MHSGMFRLSVTTTTSMQTDSFLPWQLVHACMSAQSSCHKIPATHPISDSAQTTACLVGTLAVLCCQPQLLSQLLELQTWLEAVVAQLAALQSARRLSQVQLECCLASGSGCDTQQQMSRVGCAVHVPQQPCCSAPLAVQPVLPARRPPSTLFMPPSRN